MFNPSAVATEIPVARGVGPHQPMHAFGLASDARIEHVARVEFLVVTDQCWLGMVKVTDIVLCRIFGAALVEQRPHALLDLHAVVPLRHDVVLVEDVAEEVPVVELVNDGRLDLGRQLLEPLLVVAPQRDVEGQDVLHLPFVDGTIAVGRTSRREAMKEGLLTFVGCALEEVAVARREDGLEIVARLLDAVVGHLEDEMMFEAIAIVGHPLRQMFGKQHADALHDPVAEMMAQERHTVA